LVFRWDRVPAARTKDETVKHVADLLWYHYDDLEDHKVVASKAEWDFFQRLLLILKSDADLVEISTIAAITRWAKHVYWPTRGVIRRSPDRVLILG
jgi:hypothetical protein